MPKGELQKFIDRNLCARAEFGEDEIIQGFLLRGRRVRFVEDASRGLDEGRVAACTADWRERGVEFSTAEEVIASLG